MSAVNSTSGSGGNDDVVQQVRDTYKQREAEEAKKHAQQLKKISEAHEAELENVRAEHSRQLEDLKNKTRDTITARDMQYQKEIDDLRAMHSKQIHRIAADADSGREQTETSLRTENSRVVKASEDQKNRLTKEFDDQIQEKEKNLDQIVTQYRDTAQNETTDVKKRLTDAHSRELHDLMKQRVDENNERQRMFSHTLESKDNQAKWMENTKDQQSNRLTQEFERDMNNEKENSRMLNDINRENMTMALEQNRDKFDKATAAIRKEQIDDRERLNDEVGGIGSKARALELSNQALKDQAVRDRIKSDAVKAHDLQALRNNMTANIERLEEVRKQTVDASNARVKDQFTKINQTNDQALNRTNKYYLDKISNDEIRNQERFQSQSSDNERMVAKERITGDSRAERLKNANEVEQSKMRNYFDRASAQMKENFDANLRDLRAKNQKDQDALFASFNKSATENDAKFQASVADINAKFEKQVADLQENHAKEIKDQQVMAEREKKEMSKRSDSDIQMQNSQWQNRVAKLQEQHAKEIDDSNRRHQEALANIAKTRQG